MRHLLRQHPDLLRHPRLPMIAVVAAVATPIVVAAVRAAHGDWVPAGDDAYFTVRSRDVATADHPWLGAWSSGSLDLENPINNLGPIQLDLLAPFTKIAPMGGTAIGVAFTNVAAIVAIAWMIARHAGRRAVIAAMVAVGLLTWTMGSEMLITPRQHQYLVLPYLCLLVATWTASAGDRWAVVPAVAAASLTAQTHLSYPVLVAALAAVVAVGQVVTTRSGDSVGGRRPLVVSAVLALGLWLQTLIDQVVGWGNLGHVLFGSGGADRPGIGTGIRLVTGILVGPTTLLRPGYQQSDTDALMAGWWELALVAVAVVTAAVIATRGVRAGRWRSVSGLVVAVVAFVAGCIDAALLPRTVFGLAIMNYRWVWSIGAFVVLVAVVTATTWAEREPTLRRAATWGAAATCVVLAAANLPRSVQHLDAERYLEEQRAVAEALDQIADVELEGPLIIDESAMYFGHPYTYPVLVALQQQGVDFRFESPLQERRFGAGRVVDGTETRRMRFVSGDPAVDLSTSPDLVAFVPGARPVAIVVEPATPAG